MLSRYVVAIRVLSPQTVSGRLRPQALYLRQDRQ
jgi:hypothetical protein